MAQVAWVGWKDGELMDRYVDKMPCCHLVPSEIPYSEVIDNPCIPGVDPSTQTAL